jgi:Ca-activated chloride channel homolog
MWHTRVVVAFCLALLALPALPALPAFPAPPALHAQEPSFRGASAELVVLPVIVKDKQGRYVSDLQKERFAVYDNARRMSIDLFTNEDTPVTVGLIVDASGSMRVKLGEVIAAAVAFAKSSNPDDELFAVRFNDDAEEVVRDRRFLLASDLSALETAMSALRPQGRTALYDALIAGLDHLNDGSRPRKALIVISDGGDNASRATLDAVLARAHKSNAAIYTIGVYDPDEADKNRGALKALARATGGERFEPASPGELLQVCKRIARELRSGYTIGYVPPDRDGLFHRVRVVIEPATLGLDVRTRPGYFAARSATPSSQP